LLCISMVSLGAADKSSEKDSIRRAKVYQRFSFDVRPDPAVDVSNWIDEETGQGCMCIQRVQNGDGTITPPRGGIRLRPGGTRNFWLSRLGNAGPLGAKNELPPGGLVGYNLPTQWKTAVEALCGTSSNPLLV